MFPIRTDVPLRRTPWMNWTLIALNVVVHIVRLARPELVGRFHLDPRDPQLVNYFTYAFLHVDFGHIASNMLFLYVFGNNVNERLGTGGYLAFYLSGGVVAGIAHVLTSSSPVIGASGAVSAVSGAYMVLFPASRVTVLYIFFMIGTFELQGMWFVLLFFVLDLARGFTGMLGGADAVAHMAHIGGTLFGVAVCLLMLRVKLIPRHTFDLLGMIDRWNRRRQYRDMVASGFNPFGVDPAQPRPNAPPDPRLEHVQSLRAQISEAMAHSKMDDAVKLFMELRAIDPQQTLSRQNQLDLANHLFQIGQHAGAADAYENYLRVYPKGDRAEHVQLMLGLLYGRYLSRDDRAKFYFEQVLPKLHNEREIELARGELARIQAAAPPA